MHSDFYYWYWIKKYQIKRIVYRFLWLLHKPTIITSRHPLANRIKILSNDGEDLTLKYQTIMEYNSKTKKAIIVKLERNNQGRIKTLFDENKKEILETIDLPNSYMILT